jgi:hypothetical protein
MQLDQTPKGDRVVFLDVGALRNILDVAVQLHCPELMPWLTNYCLFRPGIWQMLADGSIFVEVLRCAMKSAECSIG